MSRPKGYVDSAYLAEVARQLEAAKQASYEMLRLAPRQKILDVGCGPGTDTIPMAQIVGSGGLVVGVDHDLEMLRKADQRAVQTGLNHWVRHQKADAHLLPLSCGHV